MKINEPVTGNEISMRDEMIIVSQTDLKGLITYANSTFIQLAGFSESELIRKKTTVLYVIQRCRLLHFRISGLLCNQGAMDRDRKKPGKKR